MSRFSLALGVATFLFSYVSVFAWVREDGRGGCQVGVSVVERGCPLVALANVGVSLRLLSRAIYNFNHKNVANPNGTQFKYT